MHFSKARLFILVLSILFVLSCHQKNENTVDQQYTLTSPSNKIAINFSFSKKGVPSYTVSYQNEKIIDTSQLGFELENQAALKENFEVISADKNSEDYEWEMPWGEQRKVRDHYNQLTLKLKERKEPFRLLNIFFKAYDDGIGFRYEFPEQNGIDSLYIKEEQTEFKLTGDHKTWWLPGDWDSYERLYTESLFSEINALDTTKYLNIEASYIPENAVNTPVTMKTSSGHYLSFHEANLTDYSGMTLAIDAQNLRMTSNLVGTENSAYKVKRALPFKTPWRTIQISEKAADLIESKLIVNLNEPSEIESTPFIKPMKYVGIWWEMHLEKSSWDVKSGKHGATTQNTKKYIDFAAANKIGGVLIEGWNTGWEHWIGFEDREGVFDFVTPYPDYDLKEVARYAQEKGVEIIMHHETSAAPRTYEKQMDSAYALMNSLGIKSAKTGYVGKIIPKGEYHHGQWMVNHYRKVLKNAAKHQIAINAHEPIKPTGIRRTYPNAISREGLRGQEFNAWAADGGNPPDHLPIVAFTRMLAGPIDFTPGVFNIKLDPYKKDNQINTTLAQQLALYVVIYSPIQMACDLPEFYEGQPAFQFIRDVAVDWEQTKVLDGEVGDFVTIARQEKNSDNWFIGSITDENQRPVTIDFNFLNPDIPYEATIYKDAPDAHWDKNPTAIVIEKKEITSDTKDTFTLAPGGGLAISLKPLDKK